VRLLLWLVAIALLCWVTVPRACQTYDEYRLGSLLLERHPTPRQQEEIEVLVRKLQAADARRRGLPSDEEELERLRQISPSLYHWKMAAQAGDEIVPKPSDPNAPPAD
jgi:hypothetical protein